MKLGTSMVACVSVVWLGGFSVARAADRHEEGRREEGRREEGRHEEGRREDVRREEHARPAPPRPEPPRFQGHPPGVHPHGPMVRGHAVRVMKPSAAKYGAHPWRHWEHPEFSRPLYYWDWAVIHNITCIAEDSYGDQYPVTEETFRGFALLNMTAVEDDALDRCYAESGNDQSCFLAGCSHF